MSEIKLTADSGGGTVSLKGPATTTSNAAVPFVLPVADGSAGQYLKTDGSKNLSFGTVSAGYTRTAGSWVATTSGSEVEFSSIDANAVKIEFFMDLVSNDSNYNFRYQLGHSGGYITSNYKGSAGYGTTYAGTTSYFETTGMTAAAWTQNRITELWKLDGDRWFAYTRAIMSDSNTFHWDIGYVDVTATLTKVKFYNGNFDAGKMQIVTYT